MQRVVIYNESCNEYVRGVWSDVKSGMRLRSHNGTVAVLACNSCLSGSMLSRVLVTGQRRVMPPELAQLVREYAVECVCQAARWQKTDVLRALDGESDESLQWISQRLASAVEPAQQL